MYATGEILYILKYSVDEDTQFIYGRIAQPQGGKKQWNDVKELHERERHLFINELGRWQIGRQGLGFIKGQKRIDQMTKREHGSSVSSLTKDMIRRTPTCLLVWHGKTVSFPVVGDSHAHRY